MFAILAALGPAHNLYKMVLIETITQIAGGLYPYMLMMERLKHDADAHYFKQLRTDLFVIRDAYSISKKPDMKALHGMVVLTAAKFMTYKHRGLDSLEAEMLKVSENDLLQLEQLFAKLKG